MGDHLREHRVVVAADRHPHRQAGIHPDLWAGRFQQAEHRPAGGQEAGRGVLGVDAGLDRVPTHRDVVLAHMQLLPRRNTDLPLDEVPTGDQFGDRMFDLKSGVHLHEEELIGLVGGHDELDGAGTHVVDAAGGVARGGADACAGGRVQQRRRSLLDHLLMPALQTALTFAEMQHRAVAVSQHLHLDVPRAQHEPLEEQGVVAECRPRLPPGRGQRGPKLGSVVDPPHALATTTGGRLDQDREADVVGRGDEIGIAQAGPGNTGNHRNPERGHRGLGRDLVTHRADRPTRRPDERHAGALECGGKIGVLREESVPRVDGLRAGLAGGRHHCLDVEIALPRRRRTDAYCDVGLGDVARTGVGIAVDRDRADAHGAQCADDSHGDLAPVGDKDTVKHRHILKTP